MKAQVAAAKAQVETAQGAIEAAKAGVTAAAAAVETAKVNLGFTKLTSPIDGIAGVATMQVGNLVGPSEQRRDHGFDARSDQSELHGERAGIPEPDAERRRRCSNWSSNWCSPMARRIRRKDASRLPTARWTPSTGSIQLTGAVSESGQ